MKASAERLMEQAARTTICGWIQRENISRLMAARFRD